MVENSEDGSTHRDMSQQIAPEYRDLILDYLCDNLDISVSVLDQDLNYQFISSHTYEQLKIIEANFELFIGMRRFELSIHFFSYL